MPNGLPEPVSGRAPNQPKRRPAPGQPWRILYMSNLMESKGYYRLLTACKQLLQEGYLLNVEFCGAFVESVAEKGVEAIARQRQSQFLDEISRKPLDSAIRYRGTVSGNQKHECFDKANLMVLPTDYPWEGQPLSIIESMARGIPVISTRHAGIPEQIDHGINGWLIAEDQISAESVASALRLVFDLTEDEYQSISQEALKKYQNNFTRERHLENMQAVLNCVA